MRGYRIELGEIETVMAKHPAVTQAVVAAREDREGDKRLVGYLIADEAAISGDELEQWESDQLDQWRDLWQNAYEEEGSPLDPAFNISGWNSSYTGEPDPCTRNARMGRKHRRPHQCAGRRSVYSKSAVAPACWLRASRQTVNAIWQLTSLPAAIANIETLKASRSDMDSVEALQTNADSLTQLADQRFDAIVINSVAQYFPDQAYLLEVLTTVSSMLDDGGHLFLGDLRALPLLDLYHTSVQLASGDAQIPTCRHLASAYRTAHRTGRRTADRSRILQPGRTTAATNHQR